MQRKSKLKTLVSRKKKIFAAKKKSKQFRIKTKLYIPLSLAKLGQKIKDSKKARAPPSTSKFNQKSSNFPEFERPEILSYSEYKKRIIRKFEEIKKVKKKKNKKKIGYGKPYLFI